MKSLPGFGFVSFHVFVFLLACGGNGGHGQENQSGVDPLLTGDTREALEVVRTTFVEAIRCQGLERGQLLKQAYRELEAAAKQYPALPPARTMWAALLRSAGDQKAARASLELATLEHPEDPEAFVMLANMAVRAGQFTEARIVFDEAERLIDLWTDEDSNRESGLKAKIASGRATIADASRQLTANEGRSELAEEFSARLLDHLKSWAEHAPKNPVVFERLGTALLREKRVDEAIAAFDEARRLNPKLPVTDIRLAGLFFKNGNREAALDRLDRAIRDNGLDVKVRMAAADLLMAMGSSDAAREQIDLIIEKVPESRGSQMLDAQWYRFEGDWEKAKTELQQLHVQLPADFEIANLLALTLTECPNKVDRRRAVEMALVTAQRFGDLKTAAGRRARVSLVWTLYADDQKQAAKDNLNQLLSAGLESSQISGDESYYAAKLLSESGRPELSLSLLNAGSSTR